MKEKFNTLQSFNKSLRLNNTKGLDKAAHQDEEEYYLEDTFEKETLTLKNTLNPTPQKSTVALNNDKSANEGDRMSFSRPQRNSRERPWSKNSKNNKTFDDATNVFDKSAEFAARESEDTERRRQLNSSFEKPHSNGLILVEHKQPRRPTPPRNLSSGGRTAKLKSSVGEGEKEFLLPHQSPNVRENDQKMPHIAHKSEGRQLRHAESNVRHKSPLVKPSYMEMEKDLHGQKAYSKDGNSRATMNPTPYSDKVAAILTTDVRKRSEQVTFAQNTAIRHMIRELNEELAKLIMRQIYDPNDILQERGQRLSPSPPKKIKELNQDISVNQRVIELQNQELAKLEAKVNRIGSATYYMNLNDKVAYVKEKVKQFKMEKRKKESEFKKEMYQIRGRNFDRRDEEALNREYLEKRMKLGRMQGEYERLARQNSEAVQFIEEQKNYIGELQNRMNKLLQLAEHYHLKVSNDYSVWEDGRPVSERIKELNHRLELLKSCIPGLEKNYINQSEAIKKELQDLRAAHKKGTVILSELKEKQKALAMEIRDMLNQKDLDKQTLLKMKKIMQESKKEEDDGSFYEEILDISFDHANISSIIEGSYQTSGKSKRQITLEVSQAATVKRVLKKKGERKIADPPNEQPLNTARSRGKESIKAVRLGDKSKSKSSERVAEKVMDQPQIKINNEIQLMPTKPNFSIKKTPVQGESNGFKDSLYSEKDPSGLRGKTVSPALNEDENTKASDKANTVFLTEGRINDKSETPEQNMNKSEGAATEKDAAADKVGQSNEEKPKENVEKPEPEANRNPFKKPAFTLRGRAKIQESSSNNNSNAESKELRVSNTQPKTEANEPLVIRNDNERKSEPGALKSQAQSNEPNISLKKPLELRIPESKPGAEKEKPNIDKEKPDSKPEALTLKFESTEAKKLPGNDQEHNESKNLTAENSEPLVLNIGGNSRLRAQYRGLNTNNQNSSYMQMISSNDPQKPQESSSNKGLILPQNGESKTQETNQKLIGKSSEENKSPLDFLNKTSNAEADNKGLSAVNPKPKVEENDAPFGFVGDSSGTKVSKEEPPAHKNPNPFQFQSQQPVRLNIGGPGPINLKFRQNDLGKPTATPEKPANNSEIMTLDLNSQKQSSKNDTKSNIIDFDLDTSHHGNISSDQKQKDSIPDPFANAGDIRKINFTEKKGLFEKKREETPKRDMQRDPVWLKSSIEASKTKTNDKNESFWLKESSGLKESSRLDDSSTDRVFKFGEEDHKPKAREPIKANELSFLSQLREEKKSEIPIISAEDNSIGMKKPRMKMNSKENKKTSEKKKAEDVENDFFADLEI